MQLNGALTRAELLHSLVDVVVKLLARHAGLLATAIELDVSARIESQGVQLQVQRFLLVVISMLSLELGDTAVLLCQVHVERQVHLVTVLVTGNLVDVLVANVLIQVGVALD